MEKSRYSFAMAIKIDFCFDIAPFIWLVSHSRNIYWIKGVVCKELCNPRRQTHLFSVCYCLTGSTIIRVCTRHSSGTKEEVVNFACEFKASFSFSFFWLVDLYLNPWKMLRNVNKIQGKYQRNFYLILILKGEEKYRTTNPNGFPPRR